MEFENGSDPCTHTIQPIEYKLTFHIRQNSQILFLQIFKIEKALYVRTLSGLEEWGFSFN